MHGLSRLLLITALLVAGGCTVWPPSGHGGMAEHNSAKLSPVEAGEPLGPEHGLRFDWELAKLNLDMLIQEGAELCFPATVVQARLRQDRILRELQGGLPYDAANDLIIQRNLLARLERQLDYVKQQSLCEIPGSIPSTRPGDIGAQIHTLLNSDNQFALNSPELNPKYIGRLAEAVAMLKQHPGYNLRITGHADATGSADYNQKLSLARAEQVGRYLEVMGLPAERFEIAAVGTSAPFFAGTTPEKRLVNRRVTIELIEAIGPAPGKPQE